MSGNRINMAIEALKLFIKSMPIDSYFNIISFGSSYRKMFDISERFDENKVEKAI